MHRIVYLVSTLGQSGPTQQLLNLIANLDRSRFEAHVVTLSPEGGDSYWDRYLDVAASIQTLGLTRIEGLFKAKTKARMLLRKIDPAIIHSQGIRADRLISGFDKFVNRVATQRNYPFQDYPMKFGRIKGTAMAFTHYRAFRRIPHVVACAETIAKLDQQHGLTVRAIQNGVDLDSFSGPPSDAEKAALRERLGFGPELMFITVGALLPRKAMDVLLRAFKEARKRRPCQLVIVGEGPERNQLEDLAGDEGSVRIVGHTSNVRDYLAAADCFVSASRSEGLPNTVIEAMAMGLPLILSDIPQHLEVLQLDRKAGDAFGLDDVTELAQALVCFQPSDAARAASWGIVSNTLNAKTMSAKYQNLYLDILGGGNNGTAHGELSHRSLSRGGA